ncbi:MAG TPA: 3D domain-containing protein [Gaiellaceae bacterium]|nr:3D domain-containing protein [Gaiellaceae bacterium]
MSRSHKLPRILAVLAGVLLVLAAPAPGPAQSPGVGALQQKQASLEAQSRAAVVELYGLQSRLDQARADLGRVEARAAALGREQASVRLQLRAARLTTARAQHRLGDQLRYIYETGEADPIAVILGATSLEEAIDGLDAVHRTARLTRSVLQESRSARRHLVSVREKLALKVAQTNQAHARLADTTAGLERAQTERTAYIASLRREQQLTSEQISRLQRQAAAATVKAQEVARQASVASPQQQPAPAAAADSPPPPTTSEPTTPTEPPPAPVESVSGGTSAPPATAPPPLRPGGTMSVYATGYCLKGTTATGLPVGPGIVAVDPSVIPLGTRMTIPGYGEGVAADTGGGIKGARIDVWIKSCAQAALFNRTVTITFH